MHKTHKTHWINEQEGFDLDALARCTRNETLQARIDALLEIVSKTATEQAEVTQSWTKVAPTPPTLSPSPTASFPSILSGSPNPKSPISQDSIVPHSAIAVTCGLVQTAT